ncbi:MAG: hypothetical protein RLY58_480 [Pseudomonadota bacterium]
MHDAMMSQTKPVVGHAVLQRLSDALRQGLTDFFQPSFLRFIDDLPNRVMALCATLPDGEQQRYLDIVIELRRHRVDIESRVTGIIDAQLHRFIQLSQRREGNVSPSHGLGAMTLIDSADMEVTVALDTAGARLAQHLEPVMGDAFSRLQPLAPALTEVGALPFHPRSLLQMMLECFSVFMIGPDQKVMLVRMFSSDLPVAPLLALIPQALLQAQVPELDKTIKKSDSGGAARTEPKPDLNEVLRDIRDLSKRNAGTSGSAALNAAANNFDDGLPAEDEAGMPILHRAAGGGLVIDPEVLIRQAERFNELSKSVAQSPLMPQNVSPLAMEQVVATPLLMDMLSRLQDAQPRTKIDTDPTAPSVSEVRDSIRHQLKSDDDTVEVIGKKDTDIINLVSMMFDFILDDQDLPTAMKALIGRLQIPMLKVAIIDANFFRTEDHPARRLLNSLAKAGVGWDEQAKTSDQLYKKLEETVFTILNDFNDDIGLFDKLLEDFEAFYADQQTRVTAVDTRTREAEENRARADMARTIVQQALNRRLNGRKLPFAVVRILQEGWRHVLYLACLKEGTESESWRQAVKVVDALIWSVMPPKDDLQWVERLRSVAPKLSNSLRKGLVSVHFDTLQTETLLREIAHVHQEIIEGFEMATVEILDQETAQADPNFDGVSVDQALRHTRPNMKAVVLPKAQIATVYEGETLPSSDRHVIAVKQMLVGTWIEFIHSERRDRHKLVAKIRTSEKLIFANRRGIKVAEMSQMQLAVELSQGRARIVEEQPQIVDRALQSVVGGLRQLSA